jgi:hypothetical protein
MSTQKKATMPVIGLWRHDNSSIIVFLSIIKKMALMAGEFQWPLILPSHWDGLLGSKVPGR